MVPGQPGCALLACSYELEHGFRDAWPAPLGPWLLCLRLFAQAALLLSTASLPAAAAPPPHCAAAALAARLRLSLARGCALPRDGAHEGAAAAGSAAAAAGEATNEEAVGGDGAPPPLIAAMAPLLQRLSPADAAGGGGRAVGGGGARRAATAPGEPRPALTSLAEELRECLLAHAPLLASPEAEAAAAAAPLPRPSWARLDLGGAAPNSAAHPHGSGGGVARRIVVRGEVALERAHGAASGLLLQAQLPHGAREHFALSAGQLRPSEADEHAVMELEAAVQIACPPLTAVAPVLLRVVRRVQPDLPFVDVPACTSSHAAGRLTELWHDAAGRPLPATEGAHLALALRSRDGGSAGLLSFFLL